MYTFFFDNLLYSLLVAIYPDCTDIAHVVSTIESRDGANYTIANIFIFMISTILCDIMCRLVN